jgi:hypothetical protein
MTFAWTLDSFNSKTLMGIRDVLPLYDARIRPPLPCPSGLM